MLISYFFKEIYICNTFCSDGFDIFSLTLKWSNVSNNFSPTDNIFASFGLFHEGVHFWGPKHRSISSSPWEDDLQLFSGAQKHHTVTVVLSFGIFVFSQCPLLKFRWGMWSKRQAFLILVLKQTSFIISSFFRIGSKWIFIHTLMQKDAQCCQSITLKILSIPSPYSFVIGFSYSLFSL